MVRGFRSEAGNPKQEAGSRKQPLTCDGTSCHGLAWSRVVHRGDGHLVLTLGDEAGQVQRGDITTNLHLQHHSRVREEAAVGQ